MRLSMYMRTYCLVACVNLFVAFLDEIPQDEEYIYISLPLFIIYTIIAIFGIIFATICLILNLLLRNQKYVIDLHYIHSIHMYIANFYQVSET